MTRQAPIIDPFSWTHVAQALFAVFLYALDYSSDILVAVGLSREDDTAWWFTLTVVLVVIPLVLVNLFSIVWFHQDHQYYGKGANPRKTEFSNLERGLLVFGHLLLMGPAIR